MKPAIIIGILALAAALSGCAEQIAAADDEQCRGYGAQPGTTPYIQCRTELHTQRTAAMAGAYSMMMQGNRRTSTDCQVDALSGRYMHCESR